MRVVFNISSWFVLILAGLMLVLSLFNIVEVFTGEEELWDGLQFIYSIGAVLASSLMVMVASWLRMKRF